VREVTPAWVYFQDSDPAEAKRIVHWCLHSDASPLAEWQRDGKARYRPVIQWRTREGSWTTRLIMPPVSGEQGRRGRIRFRKPREDKQP
jgi:hypothetical protein